MSSKPIKITLACLLFICLTLIGLYCGYRRCMYLLDKDPLYGATDFDTDFPDNYSDRTKQELVKWLKWKKENGKTYQNNKKLNLQKQAIFLSNLRFIETFNSNANSRVKFKLGLNKFADLSREQINDNYIGPLLSWSNVLLPMGDLTQYMISGTTQKSESDYKDTTSQVMDQSYCMAGSVFAAIANTESHYNLVNRTYPVKLSEAQLLKCYSEYASVFGNKLTQKLDKQNSNENYRNLTICDGGSTTFDIYKTLERLPDGLSTQDNYKSYLTKQQAKSLVCTLRDTDEPRVRVESYGVINKENITDALSLIGPVTVSVDASQSTFHFYKSGYYHDLNCSPDFFNHHMLVVGYSKEKIGASQPDTEPVNESSPAQPQLSRLSLTTWIPKQSNLDTIPEHYTMKNSFGLNWGEKGYIKYLIDDQLSNCLPQGVATHPNVYINVA